MSFLIIVSIFLVLKVSTESTLLLETKVHTKVRNHGEDLYWAFSEIVKSSETFVYPSFQALEYTASIHNIQPAEISTSTLSSAATDIMTAAAAQSSEF